MLVPSLDERVVIITFPSYHDHHMWTRRLVLPKFRLHRRHYHSPVPLLDDLAQRGFIQDLTRLVELAHCRPG